MTATAEKAEGYTSASNMDRRAGCPGSQAAEAPYPFTSSAASIEGGNMHAEMLRFWDSTLRPIPLDGEQIRTCERAFRLFEELRIQEGYDGIPTLEQKIRSKALGYSGVLDAWLIDVENNRAVVVDWKFGRGEVDSAEQNYQLAAQAVLMHEKFPDLLHITVAIIQPRSENPITAASYSRDELEAGRIVIGNIVRAANTPNAPRVPGQHCKYCAHARNCPEATQTVPDLVKAPTTPTMLPADRLAQLLDVSKVADGLIKALKDEAKRRLIENPNAIPGWKLRQGRKMRHVDVSPAWAACKAAGVPREEFQQVLTVSLPTLEDVIGKIEGLGPSAAAKRVNEILGDTLVVTQSEPWVTKDAQ